MVIFGLSATVLVIMIGASVDLLSAYASRQKLSNVATLTCQYSNRPTVLSAAYSGTSGPQTYASNVNSFASKALSQQVFSLVQTQTTPFTYNPGGGSTVILKASMPTNFMQIIGVTTLPISVSQTCGSGSVEQKPTPASGTPLISEGFEQTNCAVTYCWMAYNSRGQPNTFTNTPSTSTPGAVGYVGLDNTQWVISGYCLEIDGVGVIINSVPQGTHSAELDCDNGQGTAGNSSISTDIYLAVGTYELRYNYASRIPYGNYDPIYICGSTANDLAWANDEYGANVLRTNQINVYLDKDTTGYAPTHTTIDGTQQLAGSNLIDMCVESQNWIQRSVLINVTTAGNYWLSFAADGANDSYGGQLDNIQLCQGACSGSVTDGFPFTSNQVLFQEPFTSPTYSEGCSGCGYSSATLDGSYGSSSAGWPNQASRGWATAPYDQITYEYKNPSTITANSGQYIQLDGSVVGGQSTSNRAISRYYYLDPGYYQLSYEYVSNQLINGNSGTYCNAAPTAAVLLAYTPYDGVTSPGTNRLTGASRTGYVNTSEVAVFMSHSMLASNPIGGGSLNSTTSYNNPDGTTSTTPTVSPSSYNTSTYSTSSPAQVLDFCYYSQPWTARSVYIKIQKPGQYWLNIAGQGAGDAIGGSIDNIKLTAIGSLYTTAPSGSIVTIPVPNPQPGTTVSFTGFNITADRLTP